MEAEDYKEGSNDIDINDFKRSGVYSLREVKPTVTLRGKPYSYHPTHRSH